MYYVYSAVFTPTEDGYTVEIPDIPGCVADGATLEEAIQRAKGELNICLCALEDHEEIPKPPRTPDKLNLNPGEFAAIIDADTSRYRAETDNRAVRKNVSIPAWLNACAEKAGVNFSQTLQDALKSQLHVG